MVEGSLLYSEGYARRVLVTRMLQQKAMRVEQNQLRRECGAFLAGAWVCGGVGESEAKISVKAPGSRRVADSSIAYPTIVNCGILFYHYLNSICGEDSFKIHND